MLPAVMKKGRDFGPSNRKCLLSIKESCSLENKAKRQSSGDDIVRTKWTKAFQYLD